MVLDETLESPLESKEIKPVLKKINPEYSLEALLLNLEAPILWPPDARSHHIGKDPDAGKDCREKEKGEAEVKMVR